MFEIMILFYLRERELIFNFIIRMSLKNKNFVYIDLRIPLSKILQWENFTIY